MNDERFDGVLGEWLEDGPATAPATILQGVATAIPSIRQRRRSGRAWTSFRGLLPARSWLAAVGVAAILAAAFRWGPNLLPAQMASAPSPSTDPRGGVIAFVASDGEAPGAYPDLWISGADGGGRRRLTDDSDVELDATWSPDGSRLVFQTESDTDTFRILDLASGAIAVQELPTETSCHLHPVPSPDWTWLAIFDGTTRCDTTPDMALVLAPLDGEAVPVRLEPAAGAPQPSYGGPLVYSQPHTSWSPDGSRLAFSCRQGDLTALCVARVDAAARAAGRFVAQVISEPSTRWTDGSWADPRWSPDGRFVVVSASVRPGWVDDQLLVVAADGSSQQVLVDGAGAFRAFGPTWSPEGTWIAFQWQEAPRSLAQGGLEEWRRIRPDGSSLETLDSLVGAGRSPCPAAWSPDGSRLAVSSYPRPDEGEILVADVAGSEPALRLMAIGQPFDAAERFCPAWRPLPGPGAISLPSTTP